MDEYEKKFAEMQKYIPFLEAMIERLQKVKDKSREAQLQKMQSLHGILSNSKRKLRIETLQRCEDVLQKLHNKVEKGNTTGLNPSLKKSGETTSQNVSSKETVETSTSKLSERKMMEHETPASPSPPTSPVHTSKSTPIIIPTERSDETNASNCNSKPASPDQCENVPVTAPIIIPTERKDESKSSQSSINLNVNNCSMDSNDLFSEWEMLEESENQINKSHRNTWQSVNTPGTDAATTAKLVTNNLPQKVIPESRSHALLGSRHIPTAPAPSMGGLRRIVSVFDKNRLCSANAGSVHSDARSQSPTNASEVRLKSPDQDIMFPRLKITSPRHKDGIIPPKLSPKPSTPLLVPPPSVLTEPPLSIEDLAELLSDEADSEKKDKQSKNSPLSKEQSKITNEGGGDSISKSKKEVLLGNQKNQQSSHRDNNDSKVPSSFVLTQEDIDRESERRWEEIDKHIVKLTTRRCLPNKHSPSAQRLESSKPGDSKLAPSPPRISQPLLSLGVANIDKLSDQRTCLSSPLQNIIKEKENEKEHRYTDNYERHPRQFRDSHDSGDDTNDRNTSSHLSQVIEDQIGNPGYQNHRNNSDGSKSDSGTRNVPLYQRRSQQNLSIDAAPTLGRNDDYRRENVEYFARKGQTASKMKRPPLLPSPFIPDFPNTQWGPAASYSGNIRPPPASAPNTYQHNSNNSTFHQDMWQMGSGGPPGMSGEFHQMNESEPRITQFNSHPAVRPLISPGSRPQEMNRSLSCDNGFRDEAAGPTSVIPPLLSPPGFPTGTQYRNSRIDNRPYDASYDRAPDNSQMRHSWDSSSSSSSSVRVSDVGYRRDSDATRNRSTTDGPIGRPGTPAPYPRPVTPPSLWTRDRERIDKDWTRRGRGRDRCFNDRGRNDFRTQFNRDSRRSEWERDNHNERDNRPRLNRDNRVSERDPRMRSEQRPPSPVQSKETLTTATVRDPRLTKDTLNIVDKPKDVVGLSGDRDPRRRNCESKSTVKNNPTGMQPKGKEKIKNQKLIDPKNRKDSEAEDKESITDKISKDKLQSPLESLYGVIDTKARSRQGCGLQKFKIPKIKRPDPPPSKVESLTPKTKTQDTGSFMQDQVSKTSCRNIGNEKGKNDENKQKTDKEIRLIDDAINSPPLDTSECNQLNNVVHDEIPVKLDPQTDDHIPDAPVTSARSFSKEAGESQCNAGPSKETDISKPKDEVTKEWIEDLIKNEWIGDLIKLRKSFEFSEGKQLFDQAKFLHKLSEAFHEKKLKKIKKIIESDSESSSSSKEEVIEPRKLHGKKKRRVILSDSSEEESLAKRLSLLQDSIGEQNPSDQRVKQVIKQKKKSQEKISSQTEGDNTLEIVFKTVDEQKLESLEEDEKASETCTVSEEVEVSVPKRKKSSKRREKGPKKRETGVEPPTDEMPVDLYESKDDSTTGEPEKSEGKAPQKIKNKRRNSLEMLQEDIREMFISEGVVTATGHRMCRLLKEGHSNLNSTIQNVPSMSEKKMRKSDGKQNISTNSETTETNPVEQSRKNNFEDYKGPHVSSKKRISRRFLKVVSRQFVDSSDSEDIESLIKLTTPESRKSLYDSEASTEARQSEILQKSEVSPPEIQKSEDTHETALLRRSKRVPRVLIEKTEITKIDSSKMMFDSSSDESFGIDVSELAAAVDISLHPEPQSHPDSETVESPKISRRKTRMQTANKRKQMSKKNKIDKTVDDKADDTISFTDEGSILSDISMSSSITSIKKSTRNSNSRNSTKSQQDTNQELLSNILMGLTAKSTSEKSTDEIDKESDVDADGELDENIGDTSEEIKKGVTKRKKKKFNWQLGILSKKKKKKKPSATSSMVPTTESEFFNSSENSINTRDIPVSHADISAPTDNENSVNVNSMDSFELSETLKLLEKNYNLEDNNRSIMQDTLLHTESVKSCSESQECGDTTVSSLGISKSTLKKPGKKEIMQNKINVIESSASCEEKGNENNINDETGVVSQVNTFEDLSSSEIEKLLEYGWTGQERYKCMLCTFTGKNIVHHYKVNHPDNEVLISRLLPAAAKLAIDESSNKKLKNRNLNWYDKENVKYNCRFCLFCTEGPREITKEAFYEHCTTHTGEYRFKCVSCPYQTVAKSSLKSHYYKVCRKFSENVSVAIIEDNIPDEDGMYGYICSACNFVQLKKCNLEKHLVSQHSKNSSAKVIKINMSLKEEKGSTNESYTNIESKNDSAEIKQSSASKEAKKIIAQTAENMNEVIEIIENKSPDEVRMKDPEYKQEVNTTETNDKMKIIEQTHSGEGSSLLIKDEEKREKIAVKQILDDKDKMDIDSIAEKASVTSQQESEALPSSGNLSVFVCPPEVAIKEYEIQLERKKKMQEIVENIGIKVNKDGTKKSLSIIDKLKVKMDTNSTIVNKKNLSEKINEDVISESLVQCQSISAVSPSQSDIKEDSSVKQQSELNTGENSFIQITSETEANVSSSSNCTEAPIVEENISESLNGLETKIKDPLVTFDDASQNFDSDTETSDTDMMSNFVPYESDSSIEQSEGQVSQDVDSLLEETTSDNNAPAKELMLITIQRLAAQLQNTRTASSGQTMDDTQVKVETPDAKLIPKAPDVVPLSSIKRFRNIEDLKSEKIKHEQSEDLSPQKHLIRIRRLSGDKLSVPTSPTNTQEENQLSSTEGSTSDLGADVLQTDTEEECSFLRIENVVSLAPTATDNENESSIISDIRKAVETSPIKPRVSILKNSPLILHKIGNRSVLNQQLMNSTGESVKIIPLKSLPSTSQTSKQVLANILPVQSTSKIQVNKNLKKSLFVPTIMKRKVAGTIGAQIKPTGSITLSPKQNFKIIKLTRTATLLKHKECPAQSIAIKLKSPEAYKLMLKPAKLCHLFKCMMRDCSYTTNSLEFFKNHYDKHLSVSTKEKMNQPLECQNCAYCGTVFDDWNMLEKHLLNRHAHCRYQCNYCFYRAVTQSYVELHQAVSHPGHIIAVLQCTAMRDKVLDEIVDRSETVKPFICQQECGKSFYIPEVFVTHLKTKHGPLLSMYKCHLCPATSLKPEQLVSHYKMHGIYKYQCMYCLNGSDMLWELHNHLSYLHYNLPPLVIERNLVPQAITSQDIIDQLIVRNVEDGFKYTDLVTNIGEIPEEDWQLTKKLSLSDDLNTEKISTDKLLTEAPLNDRDQGSKLSLLRKNLHSWLSDNDDTNINTTDTVSVQQTIYHNKDDESISNSISMSNFESNKSPDKLPYEKSIVNRSSQELIDGEPGGSLKFAYSVINNKDTFQIVKNSQKSDQQSNFGQHLFVIDHSEDLLKSSENLYSTDQVAKSDSFENSDGLKKLEKDGQCNSLLVPDPLSVSKDLIQNKAEHFEDSDIEILEENIDTTKKSNKPEIKISQEVNTSTQMSKINSITDDKLLETCISTPDSNTNRASNTNVDISVNVETTSEEIKQPLTLDDIKDTGFTGNDLYKCGNDDCIFSSETAELLKHHLSSCITTNENKSLGCAHCKKRFVKIGFLLEHLKTHGLKRFGCSLCKMRCTMPYQAMSHMKSKHKFSTNKLVPADPKNPTPDGLFVVQPIRGAAERGKGKKRTPIKGADKDIDKSIDIEKLSFKPDELDTLPRQAIYNREVLCAVCPYTTKVRTNMIRHLQLHAKDETVPESGPVNPVPCLDKKERMFDKMVNLASSSHQNGRMGGKSHEPNKDDADDATLPKFVPEHKRYVCGVPGCSYLTVDDTMLRCHLKALHSDEPYFRCPHCPLPQPGQEIQNIGIDKMGIHLKMHDNRLYKCSHCNHHHHHRHVVERHLSDKHAEKRPFVKVIREPESIETTPTVQDEVEEEGPDRDGNHWKCNVCDFKCIYKNEMICHASTEHDQRAQFKCTECPYKTTGKINIEHHLITRHSSESQIKYDMVYEKIKGGLKKTGESVDQTTNDEPFDTTPLWRRDMPRIRHIRGILLEDEVATETPTKSGKRKSDGDNIAGKQAKLKLNKSTSNEIAKLSDDKTKTVLSKILEMKKETEPNGSANERMSKTRAGDKSRSLDKFEVDKLQYKSEIPATVTNISEEFNELSDSDMGQFGPYGKPNGSMYVCTLCNYFETRYKHDLRDHLYRELKYKKWHCRICGFLSVNRHTLVKHFGKQHSGEEPDYEMLTPDNSIEEWVNTLLQRQTNIIKGISKQSSPRINAEKITLPGAMHVSTQPKKLEREINPTVQPTLTTVENTSKTVDLTHAISSLKDTSIEMDIDVDIDDEDSRDNDDLVIDLKEDNLDESDVQNEIIIPEKPQDKKNAEKVLSCKHCNMKFARWRGFKLHVQVTHLKRLGFLCPYCDRSTNSEILMRQHIRAKHPGFLEKIVHNPAAGGPELTNEFWEKEYGLICPKKSKKRKRKPSSDDLNKSKDEMDKSIPEFLCNICGFSALNLTGLKAHMRMHASKSTIKCAYCSFTGTVDTEVSEHWKINHLHLPFKVEDISTAGSSSQSSVSHRQKQGSIEEYSDDIEEEQVPSASNALQKLVYCCSYCSLRSSLLETVKTHWEMVHKEPKNPNESSKWKTGLPFRYKETYVPLPPPQKILQCGYCNKKGGKATLRVHMRHKHTDLSPLFVEVPNAVQEGWICQWCNEFCETENKMKHHQNMFHSHLPSRFKKQKFEEQQKGYSCPECSFTSISIALMVKHVAEHVDHFKCTYCDNTFASPSLIASHSAQVHPGLELKIESISDYESLVEKIMAKVKLNNPQQSDKSEVLPAETQVKKEAKKHAVAKKSTAKPLSRVQTAHSKMRCVARKSTNSLSRYAPGFRFGVNAECAETSSPSREKSPLSKSEGFSYYGVPSSPINLASLSTYMSVGGHQMKVNCTTLSQLMNINPCVLVKDLKQDFKNLSVFSSRT